MSGLKQKAKNIETSPSMISEDYVHAFFHCACCGKKFGEADYRREDIEEMQKHSKPLCKKCAKFLLEWQAKNDKEFSELKQKLHKIENLRVAITLEHTHPHPAFWKGWNKAIERVLAILNKEEKETK